MQQGVWIKSSYCDNSGGSCVEVMTRPSDGAKLVRDSKLGDESPVLVFTEAEFQAFGAGFVRGDFA